MGVSRSDVFLANLDPTVDEGASLPSSQEERQTPRPCVLVSPDKMNRHIRKIVVAPMTTAGRPCPSRVPVRFAGNDGHVVVDQLRTVDKAHLGRRLGALEARPAAAVLGVLRVFFAP